MRTVVILIAVLATGIANAEPQPWMKKSNPATLLVALGSEPTACPQDTAGAVRGVVEGVLVRSRIRPVFGTEDRELVASAGSPWLYVMVDCSSMTAVFSVAVEFMDFSGEHVVRYGIGGYGGSGAHGGNGQRILSSVKSSVEEAITDYLKVNFDL